MSDQSFQELKNRSLFARLKRLFSNDVIVRNIGGKKLKVIDLDEPKNFINDTNLSNLLENLLGDYISLNKCLIKILMIN